MEKPSYASARSRIKQYVEATLDGWDEKVLPLPNVLIVKISKRDDRKPATGNNIVAEIVEFT